MQIYVKGLTTTFVVCVEPCGTVESLRNLIWDRIGLPTREQRLIHFGKPLDDDLTLAENQIKQESTIHLLLSLCGGSRPRAIVMRHSIRLDSVDGAMWDDMTSRPYDTPIKCHDLPKVQAQKMSELGISRVVSSPFRRCIETAAIACKQLEIYELSIDRNLGEQMHEVKKACDRVGVSDSDRCLTYLNEADIAAILEKFCPGLNVAEIVGPTPPFEESLEDSNARFNQAFDGILEKYPSESILMVTHGGCLGAIGSSVGLCVFEVNECAFMVFGEGREIISTDGVQSLSLV